MSIHYCHHPYCKVPVHPSLHACKRHWNELPRGLREAVWEHYRIGQEVDKKPSKNYLLAIKETEKWWRESELISYYSRVK